MTDVTISTASTVVSETNFGQSPDVGTSANYTREDHTHGTPSNPVSSRSYTDQTANRTFNTVYTNNDSTRWMHVVIQIEFRPQNSALYCTISSDNSNPPTTVVAGQVGVLNTNENFYIGLEISAYIKPNENYELNLINSLGTGLAIIKKWTELLF